MRKRAKRLSSQDAAVVGAVGGIFFIPGLGILLWGIFMGVEYFQAQSWLEAKAKGLNLAFERNSLAAVTKWVCTCRSIVEPTITEVIVDESDVKRVF